MKGFWNYFWLLYALFFAIPFPMIIYYNTREEGGISAPWLALSFLALSLVLWIIVLQGLFRQWIVSTFIMKNNILRLMKKGVRKDARVTESAEMPQTRTDVVPMKITVSLQNFSGTEIREQLEVNDSKPALHRYDKGKTIQLRIDDRLKAVPYLTLDDVTISIRMTRMILLCLAWLAIVAVVLFYYGYSYVLENDGTGWRFLKFYHPLVLCPLILLLGRLGFGKLLDLVSGISGDDQLSLKYYGIRTDASILSATQTGTYINEQPQVKFELSYQDNTGITRTATLKKIIPLLELNTAQQKTAAIFYLKDKPGQVAFASDVEE
ncbi:MAG TPA: hypothetical protein VM802_05070 [Chitinophaga sp.]|uniref:hypothetical protein n=1 Tax=Chitinophaga sp. TaxID=1869181 RepID=UPI002C332312|nr:hypothetical protein [Chitinophaga sp.]HVI44213.1 hypothetical protein [Chitinophaga sp.]